MRKRNEEERHEEKKIKQTSRSEKKAEEEVPQVPEQRFSYSPWWRPW